MAGSSVDPKPDPWEPPRANAAQATSIATGATGVALLIGSEPPDGQSLLMLPDPTEIFSRVAHVLGFQFDASSAWTWGLILVILSVALNIYSYLERYFYAKRVKPLWDEQIPRLEREAEMGRTLAAKAQGSGGGAA
jgi:hypothetical protein